MKESELRQWIKVQQRGLIGPEQLQYILDNFRKDRRNYSVYGRLDLTNCKFIPGDYSKIDFHLFELQGVEFNEVVLGASNFHYLLDYATIADFSFEGLILEGIDLRGTNFNNYKIKGLNLHGAKLDGTSLLGLLYHVRNGDAQLAGANFSGISIEGELVIDRVLGVDSYIFFDLGHLDLSKCNFSNAKLVGVDFNYSQLEGCNFTDCKMLACHAENTNFRGTDFSNADLCHSNFRRADFSGAIFNNTKA